jgi:hypothetical protein
MEQALKYKEEGNKKFKAGMYGLILLSFPAHLLRRSIPTSNNRLHKCH